MKIKQFEKRENKSDNIKQKRKYYNLNANKKKNGIYKRLRFYITQVIVIKIISYFYLPLFIL